MPTDSNRVLHWSASVLLVSALLFGGGTHAGFPGDVIAQLVSIACLAVAIWSLLEARSRPSANVRRTTHYVVIVTGAAIGLAVIQLVPLPLSWRQGVAGPAIRELFAQFPPGADVTALPNSLSPHATSAALIATLPAIAMWSAVVQLDAYQRRSLVRLLTATGVAAAGFGFIQVMQGPDSPFRFFSITNPTEAVGFFANRNHHAAQLVVTLTFAGVALLSDVRRTLAQGTVNSKTGLMAVGWSLLIVLIVAGLALARSRAGILMTMLALIALAAMAMREAMVRAPTGSGRHRGGAHQLSRSVIAVLVFASFFAMQFGLHRIMTRFEVDPLADLRIPLSVTTFEVAVVNLPLGTGLASFVPVYASVERTDDIRSVFANRAHNDLAEWLLETGLIGLALLAMFIVWFGLRVWRCWGRRQLSGVEIALYICGASIAVALLLLHSLVDYPLRTTALSVTFALCCGLLTQPARNSAHRTSKDTTHTQPAPAHPVQRPAPAHPWTTDQPWPDAWSKQPPSGRNSPDR